MQPGGGVLLQQSQVVGRVDVDFRRGRRPREIRGVQRAACGVGIQFVLVHQRPVVYPRLDEEAKVEEVLFQGKGERVALLPASAGQVLFVAPPGLETSEFLTAKHVNKSVFH